MGESIQVSRGRRGRAAGGFKNGAAAIMVIVLLSGCDPCVNNPCDDGLACNGQETCTATGSEAGCLSGLPVACLNGTFCAEPDGTCVDPCLEMSCDDGDACTMDDCTADSAGAVSCAHDVIEGCCQSDADCGKNEQCVDQACRFTGDESNPCLTFEFVSAPNNLILPGVQTAPLTTADGSIQIGTVAIEFRDVLGADYSRGTQPVVHIGIGEGQVDVDLISLELISQNPIEVTGIRVFPLFSKSINSGRPLLIQGLDEDGELAISQSFSSVPDNVGSQDELLSVDLLFDGAKAPVSRARIVVPQAAFITVQQICLTTAE